MPAETKTSARDSRFPKTTRAGNYRVRRGELRTPHGGRCIPAAQTAVAHRARAPGLRGSGPGPRLKVGGPNSSTAGQSSGGSALPPPPSSPPASLASRLHVPVFCVRAAAAGRRKARKPRVGQLGLNQSWGAAGRGWPAGPGDL